MKIKFDLVRIGIIFFTILFIGSAVVFEIYELGGLPAQFFGALLGVVITAIITVLLLQGQTKNEEAREIHLKVFEKKQEVYFSFLQKLNHILQNKEFKTLLRSLNDTDTNDFNLHDLFFELGYLQMHTSSETFDAILLHLENLLDHNLKLKQTMGENKKTLHDYYYALTKEFFAIVTLLKTDLYHDKKDNLDYSKLVRIFNKTVSSTHHSDV